MLLGFVQKQDSHNTPVRMESDVIPLYVIGDDFPIPEHRIREALSTWTATCSNLEVVLTETPADGVIPEGSITVQWDMVWTRKPGLPAETDTEISGGRIIGAHIFMNGTQKDLSPTPPDCSSGKYDAARVFAHEVGHAIGFDHAEGDPGRRMFATALKNKLLDPLDQDGRNGICAVYPVREVPPEVGCSCTAIPGGRVGLATILLVIALLLLRVNSFWEGK